MRDISLHQHRIASANSKPFPLSDDQVGELIRMVHEIRESDGGQPKRKSTRFGLEGQRFTVTIMHPGGSLTASECVLIDVSEGGAGFLYPGFVHNESACVAHLHTLDGDTVLVAGGAVWCRFVSRSIHAVGVRWDESMEVRKFVTNREWLEQVANSDEIKQAKLSGTIVLVGFDEIEVDLFGVLLEGEDVRIEAVEATGAAHDRLARGGVDAVLVDAENPDIDAKGFLADARSAGVHEPFTIVTSKPDAYEVWAADAGAAVYGRPVAGDMLVGLLREQILMSANPLAGSQPIYTSLPIEKHKAVTTYIDRLERCSEQIEHAISNDDAALAVRIAQTVQNTAEGYGFPILEQASAMAITAVNASMSAAEAGSELRQLIRLIGRLRCNDRISA